MKKAIFLVLGGLLTFGLMGIEAHAIACQKVLRDGKFVDTCNTNHCTGKGKSKCIGSCVWIINKCEMRIQPMMDEGADIDITQVE